MRWKISWEAVAVGVLVFALWVGLDPYYKKMGGPADPWNPALEFGFGSFLAKFFVIVRILGSTLVVPPLEEVFYRSLLYRYVVKPEFHTVSLGYFNWTAFLVTSAVFGFAHREWLAGVLCGMAYQGLVLRKKRLGDAITAHAITNLLLGLWVLKKGAWHFW
jgi:CAAX prenyl protease-like protein